MCTTALVSAMFARQKCLGVDSIQLIYSHEEEEVAAAAMSKMT